MKNASKNIRNFRQQNPGTSEHSMFIHQSFIENGYSHDLYKKTKQVT
jgi:hypothetical protein